jgi:HK97 family phage prohead protease
MQMIRIVRSLTPAPVFRRKVLGQNLTLDQKVVAPAYDRKDASALAGRTFRIVGPAQSDSAKTVPQSRGGERLTIEGYLSTFGNMDRDGEFVLPGAFKDSIQRFLLNPVLLSDHINSVTKAAGRFVQMKEDDHGLFFVAEIGTGPDLAQIRSLITDGILKTVSMGGLFHFSADGRGIFKVELFEGSLTPIPSNPLALFTVR